MKKTILILCTLAITAIAVPSAFAHEGYGPHHNGERPCQQLTPEQMQTRDAFMKETAELRQSLMSKKREYRALMFTETPDPKRAGELTTEIVDLQNQLHKKAKAAGIPNGDFKGRGMGRGHGHHKGRGGYNCGEGCGW